MQAAQAVLDNMNRVSTPAQAQQAAAQTAALAATAPPEVKAQAAQAQQAAAQAVTPAQVQAAKDQLEIVLAAIKTANKPSMPAWQIALIAGGSVAGLGLLVALFASMRTARAS